MQHRPIRLHVLMLAIAAWSPHLARAAEDEALPTIVVRANANDAVHGSALALARIVAAILENNQTPEGIHIPVALRPYTGFDMIRP